MDAAGAVGGGLIRFAMHRATAIAELAADPRPRAFAAPWGSAVVHRDTYKERRGEWRVTFLNVEGDQRQPHAPAESYAAALEAARDAGADLASEVLT